MSERIYTAPGKSLEEWKKAHPDYLPNKTTKTTKILKPGENVPFKPGVPKRGGA